MKLYLVEKKKKKIRETVAELSSLSKAKAQKVSQHVTEERNESTGGPSSLRTVENGYNDLLWFALGSRR